MKDQLIITKEMLEKYHYISVMKFGKTLRSAIGLDKMIEAKSLKQLQDKLNKLIC